MKDDLQTLAAEVADLIGVDLPGVLADDAPVPADVAVTHYHVGLIGGKDVGKTSLANALAGTTLAEPIGHGEGTRNVTAFCHRAVATAVRRELPDVNVVPHEIDRLQRQVLLDLPDIDSRYADHLSLTRKTLRHMLYPVWVQSVEKYADARPRDLLKQVAAGNDPQNFVFVLSKVDQLVDREGEAAARELADDYAGRIADALELPAKPRVYLVSAHRPDQFDLPELRQTLGIDRSEDQVTGDHGRAMARRRASVVAWLGEQRLDERAAEAKRLLDETADLLAERAGAPVLETALPRLAEDAGHRMAVAEPAAAARVRAWPLVGWIDLAAAPLVALVRRNLMPATTEAASLDEHLAHAGESTAGNVRATFASLRASHPQVADLYADRHLWESPAAEAAATDLRRRLTRSLDRQRDHIADKLRPTIWLAPIRWLLTVGVVLWFAILQPLLAVAVPEGDAWSWTEALQDAVLLLNATTILSSLGFALVWLLLVWIAVRLRAYRLVAKHRTKLLRGDAADVEASPAAQVIAWMDDLLGPLHRRHALLAKLVLAVRQSGH